MMNKTRLVIVVLLAVLALNLVSAYDSNWQVFNTNFGAYDREADGDFCGPSCTTQGGYCGNSASGFGLSWIQIAYECTGGTGAYTFLCGSSSCNLMTGAGMGQTLNVPSTGQYYVSINAGYDSDSTPEVLYVGTNAYGSDSNRRQVYDFSSKVNCTFKQKFQINWNPAQIWAETAWYSGSVHLSKFRVSDCIPDDVNLYCDDGSTIPSSLKCSQQIITCSSNSQCNDNNQSTFDECILPGTTQSYCRNTQINCFSDSQCGLNGLIGNNYCSSNNVFRNNQTSICHNPGTTQSYCTSTSAPQLIQSCSNGCSNGQCNSYTSVCGNGIIDQGEQCDDGNNNNNDACSNSCTTNQISCNSDSQCGLNGLIGNNFCSGLNIVRNYTSYTCNNPGTAQSYCSSSTSEQINQSCQYACSSIDVQCLTPICNSNLDCNDNNSTTIDQCINPGTLSSSCVNTPITNNTLQVIINYPVNNGYATGPNNTMPLNYTVIGNVSSCSYSLDNSQNISLPGCLSTTIENMTQGNHSITVSASNSSSTVSQTVNFIYDSISPVVSLISPSNGSTLNNISSITFTYNVSDLYPNLCELWGNFNGGFAKKVNAPAANGQNSVSISLFNSGNYTWNILCFDSANNKAFAPSNYTFELINANNGNDDDDDDDNDGTHSSRSYNYDAGYSLFNDYQNYSDDTIILNKKNVNSEPASNFNYLWWLIIFLILCIIVTILLIIRASG